MAEGIIKDILSLSKAYTDAKIQHFSADTATNGIVISMMPAKSYFYCLRATNAANELAKYSIGWLTTSYDGSSISKITASENSTPNIGNSNDYIWWNFSSPSSEYLRLTLIELN